MLFIDTYHLSFSPDYLKADYLFTDTDLKASIRKLSDGKSSLTSEALPVLSGVGRRRVSCVCRVCRLKVRLSRIHIVTPSVPREPARSRSEQSLAL